MAKVSVLVDTDVFIDYFNSGRLAALFDSGQVTIYYSVVTRKELLSKPGLRQAEREAIRKQLVHHRMIKLDEAITRRYSELRDRYRWLEKEDALIAATALVKKLPLLTRNWKHFKLIEGLMLPTVTPAPG